MAGVDGRVVIVTGAGGGLGRQHALLFAEHGARVVVNDLGGARDGTGAGSEMADETVGEIVKGVGGEAVANYDNVAEPEGAAAVVQTALDAFGRVDVVVNNAGILRDAAFHKMSDAQWDGVVKVHLSGTYHVTRAAWPLLREQGFGRVIVTTSTAGIYGNFGQTNYSAAKLGLVGLIKALAIEGARYNITANAIAPLATTRMTEDIFAEELKEQYDPAYVSPAVVQLAREECEDTGVAILAGGGLYAKVELLRSTGVTFDHVPTVDELAAQWSSVLDLSAPTSERPQVR